MQQVRKQLDIKEPIRVWNLHDRAAGLFSLLYEDYTLSLCEICDGDVILVEKYVNVIALFEKIGDCVESFSRR